MAVWASDYRVPCVIEYIEEYHEQPAVSVQVIDDEVILTVYGMDDLVQLCFELGPLGKLIDALSEAEEFAAEGGDDGDTDSGGECVKYSGVDHLATPSVPNPE